MSISEELRQQFREKSIDERLTMTILNNFNAGKYDDVEPVQVDGVPSVEDAGVLDLTSLSELRVSGRLARARLRELLPDLDPDTYRTVEGTDVVFSYHELDDIGVRLYPRVSYGVLNGGSATSYADEKKNRAFNEQLFTLLEHSFQKLAASASGRAKGITPAFLNPDGSMGPSFLELKMRNLLVEAIRYSAHPASGGIKGSLPPLLPMFQMTSVHNDQQIRDYYAEIRGSNMLQPLISATGLDPTRALTGVQSMLAAYTQGRPKDIFTEAHGKDGEVLAIPGGHGQNFLVLRDVYKKLHEMGKRFVYLGNVDNIGFTPNARAIACLALTGKQAGFDFSFRTPVDVKGGVLVRNRRGSFACADLGVGLSREDLAEAEQTGAQALFNCATGLFDLSYLIESLDHIIEHLPMRWSDQNKDAGSYSQAEQVTWEVIEMLDDILIFGIDKYDRFLAAKMLLETLMTSGIGLDIPEYPEKDTASRLHRGLTRKLSMACRMRLVDGRWVPLSVDEIRKEL